MAHSAMSQPSPAPQQAPNPGDARNPPAPGDPWDFLRGVVILLGFLAVGEALAPLLARVRLPVPGSVIGLILLFTALRTGIVRAVHITRAARALLALLPLLLVPAGVGVFVDGTLSGMKGLWYAGAVVALTVGSLAVVGLTAQRWLRGFK